jgi:adenylate kinase
VQVECLKLLFDEMIALRREFFGTLNVIHFKQPIFHIMVLFVDEAESVARQLKRGRQVVAHNEEVTRSGVGERWEERNRLTIRIWSRGGFFGLVHRIINR